MATAVELEATVALPSKEENQKIVVAAPQLSPQQLRGQQSLLNLIFGVLASLALRAVVQMGIPELLAAQEGPEASLSAQQIAARLPSANPNVGALDRILKYLVGKDVFHIINSGTDDDQEPRYSLTDTSSWLLGSTGNLSPVLLQMTHDVSVAAWSQLHEVALHNCTTGAFERANSKPIFAYCRDHPEYSKIINDSMASFTEVVMAELLNQYRGFEDLKSVVDVGGGVGATLAEILSVYPHMKGINFDQPHVVATAPTIAGIEHVGGDMFVSVPSADGVFIKNTLINWDDEKCIKILQNCHKALPCKKGKIIIAETVSKISSSNASFSEQMSLTVDIIMLTNTNGGMARTENQWRNLLAAAGFTDIHIFEMPLSVSIIEAFA